MATTRLALYGNFRKGRTYSKFLKFKKVIEETTTLENYFMYVGTGAVPKLYEVTDVGNIIHIQIADVDSKSIESFLNAFDLELKTIKTKDNTEVLTPFQRENDVDLVLIDKGMSDGK